MKSQRSKPWLTSTGVEMPTEKLQQICRSWNQTTWEEYLKWYEAAQSEKLIAPDLYDDLVECESLSVFVKVSQGADEAVRSRCERLLNSLPQREAQVLRLNFYEGRTVREIAALEQIPKSSVHDIKNRALSRLRQGHHGDGPDTRHLMRGECSTDEKFGESVWTQASSFSIKEAKVYDPARQDEAFEEIQRSALKAALRELSERQRRIIYLRFWCDYSISEIARDLRCGVNLIEQVLDATISKLKRKIIEIEVGYSSEGRPSCA